MFAGRPPSRFNSPVHDKQDKARKAQKGSAKVAEEKGGVKACAEEDPRLLSALEFDRKRFAAWADEIASRSALLAAILNPASGLVAATPSLAAAAAVVFSAAEGDAVSDGVEPAAAAEVSQDGGEDEGSEKGEKKW